MSGQVLRRGSDWHLRLIDLDADLAPLRKWIEVGPTLDQALSEFFSPSLERVGTDGEWPLRFVGLEELHQLSWVEEVEEVIDELVVVAIVPMQQPPQLLNIILPWFSLAQFTDVHEDVDGLLDLEVDHADINWFIIRLALVLKWRSIAVNVLVAFFGVLDVIIVFLTVLELLVDLLIILLSVLLFLKLFLVLPVLFLEMFLLDLSFFLRHFLFHLLLFDLLGFLRRHFLLPLLPVLSNFLLFELVLDLDLRLLLFLTLHLLFECQGSKGILTLYCSFCFVDDLEELLAAWLYRQRRLAWLGGAISNLLMFCRLGAWLCLPVSIELAHL